MKKAYKILKKYIKNKKVVIIIYYLLSIISIGLSFANIFFLGNFIDVLVNIKYDLEPIILYSVYFILIQLTAIILEYIINLLYIKIQSNIAYNLNEDLIKHVQEISLTKSDKYNSAYLTERLNHDSNTLVIFVLNFLKDCIANGIIIIVSLYFITKQSYRLLYVMIFSCLIYISVYLLMKNKIFDINLKTIEKQSNFFKSSNDAVSDIKYLKIHSAYEKSICLLRKSFLDLYEVIVKKQKIEYAYSSIDILIQVSIKVVLFLYGGKRFMTGDITIGEFTIILSLMTLSLDSVKIYFNIGKELQTARTAVFRIINIFSIKMERNGKILINNIDKIYIKNLNFYYEGKLERVIDKLSSQFIKGNIYIIKGMNGSGKSTLINLILGLYIDEYEGSIEYNDLDIKSLDMKTLRRKKIGVCEQEPKILFDFKFEVSDDKVNLTKQLISDFRLEHLVFYENNELICHNDSKFSGGEKQKIVLLFNLVSDFDVLILDEPSSALDVFSSDKLLSTLNCIKNEKIIIIITHTTFFDDIANEILKLNKI